MESWVGKTLGKVQIESLIGRGGVAEVYLGTHTTLDRKVAVKILRNLDEEDSDKLERFKREARVIAKLRHPNIVQVHDFDAVDNNPYLVMEFIEGPSLSKYLNNLHQHKGRLPLPQVIRTVRAVASALQYAHNNGIVHRDVKPGNILLTSPSRKIEIGKPLPDDFEPVLTDFGLVRFQDGHRQTTTGHIAGTPAYMSPEQSRGEAVDGRADVYSLGIVLYEMLAGDVPFDGESTVSILLKQVTEPPPPIPSLPPLLQVILDRALAKNIKDRFQTPMELAEALSAAVDMKYEAATIEFNELATILPSEAVAPVQLEAPIKMEGPAQPRARWLRFGVPAIIVLALGGFLWLNGIPSAAPEATSTATVPAASATYASTDTSLPPTGTSTQTLIVLPSGPIGILHFRNGSALVDQASLITEAMPAPPPGSQYEVWLIGVNKRLSLGTFIPDGKGHAELTFSDPGSLNLISLYEELEVTIEPESDANSQPSGIVAYSFTLPKEGLTHIRYLLSTFSRTPDKSALIQGLYTDIQQLAELAKEMQDASQSGDQKTVRQKAETALNLLVGAKSADYKDWDGDGKIEPRKSYGLLFNGSEFGYIQASYKEAEYIVSTSDATQYMIDNGKVVKTCTENLTQWAPNLRELLLAILNAAPDADTSESINQLVTLTDQILNGMDVDKNGKVDPLTGECGALTAYEYAYRMADMPIMPASIAYQLTVVANSTLSPATGIPGNNANGTSVASTPKAKPTQKSNPTQKAKPTQKPSGGGGGGNNGGGGGNNGGGDGNNGGGNDKPKDPKK